MRKLSILVLVAMLVSLFSVPIVGAQDETTDYTVVAGDTLNELAGKFLGDNSAYMEIVQATNAAGGDYAFIEDPDLIEIGWKLLIPAAAKAIPVAKRAGTPGAQYGGDLIVDIAQDIDVIDVQKSTFASTATVMKNCVDRLVWQDPGDTGIYPWLAKSWTVSPDGKSITLMLRDDVTFHDGTPFNAEAVKYNFDRIADPDTLALLSKDALGPYVGCDVVDEFTVRVNFSEPYAGFLPMAATSWLGFYSPTALEKWGEEFDEHLTASGPFVFDEYVPKDYIKFHAYEDYNWAPDAWAHQGRAYVDTITYKIVTETSTRVARLDAGETHYIQGSPAEDALRYDADPDFGVWLGDCAGRARSMHVNVSRPPTDDLEVRKAVALAIDRDAISEILFLGYRNPNPSNIDVNTLGWVSDPEGAYPYDPELAEQTLEAAGWTDSDGDGIREKDGQNLHIVLGTFDESQFPEMATMLQSQLAEVGFEVELNIKPVVPWCNDAMAGDVENAGIAWFWYPDPVWFRTWYHSDNAGGNFNVSIVTDPKLDEMIAEGETIVDVDARLQHYIDMADYVLENVYDVGLVQKKVIEASSGDFHDAFFSPTGYCMFYDAWLDQ